MAPDESGPRLTVSVAFSPRAGEVDETVLQLEAGATVIDAIRSSRMQERHPGFDLSALPVGVWGSFCEPGQVLRERDRVEIYRPLKVDPKEALRLRYRASTGKSKGSKGRGKRAP